MEDNRSSYILSIAVFLTALNATVGMPLEKENEFWDNPCTINLKHGIRHSRSSGIDSNETRMQMKMFIQNINRVYKKELEELYPNYPPNGSTIDIKCLNVKALMKYLNKFKTQNERIEVFYKIIISVGKFTDKLMNIPVTTTMKFNVSKRNDIYQTIRHQLRALACEFNATITSFRESHPSYKEPYPVKVPKLNEKCLVKSLDSSSAHMVDVDFIKKFRLLFRRSQKVLRKAAKPGKGKNRRGGKKNKNKLKNRKRTKPSG